MAVEVILPKVDMDMATGKISKWHVKEGDRVTKGAPLFEIETDKAAMEIEAPADGVIRNITAGDGVIVPVGQAVAHIYADGEAAPEAVAAPRATPLARQLARQGKIDLAAIKGSGPHGRIVAEDVRSTQQSSPTRGEDVVAIPLDAMRRTIAQRLTLSRQTIPHFHLATTCTIDELLKARARLNAHAPKAKDGVAAWKLSINDFIIKAFALALQKVPAANAQWAGDGILQHRASDIGVAVSVEGGLFTPVIRAAETKTLSAISTEMKSLAARARTKSLQPADYQGGSAAISNLGMYGIEQFTAIINPPHASILAIGAGIERFVPVEGQPVLKTQMTCTLSCDHRVIDGAAGAALLQSFRSFIEEPALMLA